MDITTNGQITQGTAGLTLVTTRAANFNNIVAVQRFSSSQHCTFYYQRLVDSNITLANFNMRLRIWINVSRNNHTEDRHCDGVSMDIRWEACLALFWINLYLNN